MDPIFNEGCANIQIGVQKFTYRLFRRKGQGGAYVYQWRWIPPLPPEVWDAAVSQEFTSIVDAVKWAGRRDTGPTKTMAVNDKWEGVDLASYPLTTPAGKEKE